MKDAFENSFKKSLDNFEVPYDASAWEAMRSRLDAGAGGASNSFEQQMKDGLNANEYPYNPAAWSALESRLDGGKKGGFKKWYVAAGIVAIASVSAYLLYPSGETPAQSAETPNTHATQPVAPSNSNTTSAQQAANGTTSSNAQQSTEVNGQSSNTAGAAQNDPGFRSNPSDPVTFNAGGPQTAVDANNPRNTTNTGDPNRNNTASNPQSGGPESNSAETPELKWEYISPEFGTLCKNTSVQIENKNDYPLMIVYPNGLNWVGRSNSVTTLNPSMAGVYKVGYLRKDKFQEQESFVVAELDEADFEFVDLSEKYLDGLPTTEVRALSDGQQYTWSYRNGKADGIQANLHFYKKGLHHVTLDVTGANGCKSSVSKTVSIDEDYNLMAVNAFFPNGNDIETNTFMPFALTKRDVSFTLIVVDPNDGHLIFSTTEAAEGWDGIDRSTGSLVELERNYIWKVTINNPEQGESSEYAGTILPLPTR